MVKEMGKGWVRRMHKGWDGPWSWTKMISYSRISDKMKCKIMQILSIYSSRKLGLWSYISNNYKGLFQSFIFYVWSKIEKQQHTEARYSTRNVISQFLIIWVLFLSLFTWLCNDNEYCYVSRCFTGNNLQDSWNSMKPSWTKSST